MSIEDEKAVGGKVASDDVAVGGAAGKAASDAAGEAGGKAVCRSQGDDGRGITRRSLLYGIGGITALLGLGCLSFAPKSPVVRPPGGQDEARLIASCIRCERCVEACPHDAIKLSHIENGVVSMRTPEMTFSDDFCNFCETENGGVPLCVEVCPTSALSLPAGIVASEEPIGKAELIRDWCLAYHDTGCHVCYEACPYEAIDLDEYRCPTVVNDACNGCGACEAACVSLTNGSLAMSSGATSKAIVVRPLGMIESI
ncbi:4Fe-4S dicluster domain-containing protein [Xiamenia xianingshaonis]|uniref:4Fe-4S dicluster domain-containing protein n=1 Tax=Xiamenia xianingshaonis TaxID=2682776 RepID=A0ABX0IFR7_9ACTN|nr:4Fe-4S dicluster domain-containing protein [Xiamenia xianingshaonis]NHM13570.1 4Fe-4S dicluster domain-containing protein [Xiamenia xianingshaonis]